MIIPALIDYYDRLQRDPDSDIAPFGFSRQLFSFEVVLSKGGANAEICDARLPGDDRPMLRPLVVPGQSKPSGSGMNPCLLWDNAQYMLAFKPDDPKPERTAQAFEAFRDKHITLGDEIDDDAFAAVCRFLSSWTPKRAEGLVEKAEFLSRFGVFRIAGEQGYVHERPAVLAWWQGQVAGPGGEKEAPSLVNGRVGPVARLHEPKIKNIRDAQSSGATIVSFNQDSFESYGKSQGTNSPLGVEEAFKYCTALNRLTGDPKRRVVIGDTTVVFWTESQSGFEDHFLAHLTNRTGGEDTATLAETRGTLAAIARGRPIGEIDPETRFFVLGLAPNAARLSVRIWLAGTVREFAEKIERHYADLAMEPAFADDPQLSIRRLVNETVRPKGGWPDESAVSPLLSGAVLRSVLTGGPYPHALLSAVIDRARVEGLAAAETRTDWRAAQHRRCAIIRACLVRLARVKNPQADMNEEVPVSLNESNPAPAYQLGRLFSALEKTQEDALPGLAATIKDRYFGSASSTPATVFPRLLRMHQHHIEKLEGGLKVIREKLIQEIVGRVDEFPHHLPLNGQGLFAIGYYHQRQAFFTKKNIQATEPLEA